MEKAIRQQISKIYNPGHTLVIGIDGLSGSGKSTISEEICKHLRRENYNTILLHIDDFIHPRNVRYNDSISEWEVIIRFSGDMTI